MLNSFETLITFYLNSIADFLMEEPIKYLWCALLLLVVIKVLLNFLSFERR